MKQNLDKIVKMTSLYLFTVALLLSSTGIIAEPQGLNLYEQGQEYYAAGNYTEAITTFTEAVEISPEKAEFHHMLGKSYGQLARQSGIIKAYNLSLKTRDHLERAVELDSTSIEALADLLKYYEQAPAFLGGSPEKAEKIRIRLEDLGYQDIEKPEV